MSTGITNKESKPSGVRGWLQSKEFGSEIAKVLPAHITPERMVRTALTATLRIPDLAKCDENSFFNCMMQLSQLGLEPDGRRAHLIPFYNSNKKRYECQLIIDYKGIVDLILRTGKVSAIHCDKICENDDFVYDCGNVVHHKIDFKKPRGKAYAFICVITLKDGTRKCEVMTLGEIEAIRSRSKAANNGPWKTDFEEMAKKTVFKRAAKWVEWSTEVKDAMDYDEPVAVDFESSFPAGLLGHQDTDADDVYSAGEITEEEFELRAALNRSMTVQALNALRSRVSDSNVSNEVKAEIRSEISDRIATIEETEQEASTSKA